MPCSAGSTACPCRWIGQNSHITPRWQLCSPSNQFEARQTVRQTSSPPNRQDPVSRRTRENTKRWLGCDRPHRMAARPRLRLSVPAPTVDIPPPALMLPGDILERVFERVDASSLASLSCVCHSLRLLASCEALWRAHCQALCPSTAVECENPSPAVYGRLLRLFSWCCVTPTALSGQERDESSCSAGLDPLNLGGVPLLFLRLCPAC